MKRRSLLKSLGAVGLLPLVPTSTLGALTTVPAGTYKWAETIVRAHNSCNLAMLQRHLKLDLAMAKSVQAQLIRNFGAGARIAEMFEDLQFGMRQRLYLRERILICDIIEILKWLRASG